MEQRYSAPSLPERLCTIKEAANQIGCLEWQLRRTVMRGDIPHYSPYNSRKLVKISDILAHIETSRDG